LTGVSPLVNGIVAGEVGTGLKPWEVADFEAFLEPVELIQPGPDASLRAGRSRAEARASGRTLRLADALTAVWLVTY
jgi:predicted nucleic acid-binding protein